MLRFAFLGAVLCAVLVGGCGGDDGEADPTIVPIATSTTLAGRDTPLAAATAWLDALSIGQYPVADVVVVEEQFVLMLAVESFSVELYEELVSRGISEGVSRTFWESFSAGVRGFTGADITEIELVGERRFTAGGNEYAEVAAVSPRGDLTVVTVRSPDGKWFVDLLATFGPSFAPLFNQWVDRLPPGAVAPRQALTNQRASLEVARSRALEAGAEEARLELEALIARLSG
ncbi:MAG: hypothetical protein HKN80_09200 [Acidimicrobiia bacterium]|nr:hypothetical protein [Acidimicrobiia bacterium]